MKSFFYVIASLSLLFTAVYSQGISPFGFEDTKVFAVSMWSGGLDADPILTAAIQDSGVYLYRLGMDCDWESIGLKEKAINRLYIQRRGTGPMDYFRVYAAPFSETYLCRTAPERMYYKDMDLSDWVQADSGISVECGLDPQRMDGFDFGGHESPRPVFAAFRGHLYRFDNTYWNKVSPDSGAIQSFRFVRVSPSDGRVYTGGSSAVMTSTLYFSVDSGTTWQAVTDSLIAENTAGEVNDLVIHPSFSSHLYAAMGDNVIRSTDGGQTWTETGLKHINQPIRGLALADDNDAYILAWAQTDTATIYESFDWGDTWEKAHNPNRHFHINDMDFGLDFGCFEVYFATDSGLYVYPHLWTGLPRRTIQPAQFTLEQNRPNPLRTNAQTEIRYTLRAPVNGVVTLNIYNVLGQNVRTLVNRAQPPGSYSVHFDASALPNGVYFYRLSCGAQYSRPMKLVLIR